MGLRVLAGLLLAISAVNAGGEIFGTIHTIDGRTLVGPIRWDNNENFWDDRLDVERAESIDPGEEGFRMTMFGWQMTNIGGTDPTYPEISIPFGELRSLEPLDDDRVLLSLKNGEEFEVRPSSSDLGRGMRGVEIDDASAGRVELSWRSLKRVEFAGTKGPGRDAERLYGTVDSSAGSFTGFVVWDRDESLGEDVLDGYDDDGDEQHLAFERIRSIERTSRGSRIVLIDGKTFELDDTNDVDSGHRGVVVAVAGLGLVDLEWEEFERVTFADAPRSREYASFDGGRALRGKVLTRNGREIRGEIVWGEGKSRSWELLEGRSGRLVHRVCFADVGKIRPGAGDTLEIELRNGKQLVLDGRIAPVESGLVVRVSGDESTRLAWSEITAIELAPRPSAPGSGSE